MITYRKTRLEDLTQVEQIDQYFDSHEDKHRAAIKNGTHFSAWKGDEMVGLALFNYGLFGNAFIWLLMTSKDHRRQGIGTRLIEQCELGCENDKLFVSTQSTNHAMNGLLSKLGYEQCGAVQFLNEDPEDDEIFYCKNLP